MIIRHNVDSNVVTLSNTILLLCKVVKCITFCFCFLHCRCKLNWFELTLDTCCGVFTLPVHRCRQWLWIVDSPAAPLSSSRDDQSDSSSSISQTSYDPSQPTFSGRGGEIADVITDSVAQSSNDASAGGITLISHKAKPDSSKSAAWALLSPPHRVSCSLLSGPIVDICQPWIDNPKLEFKLYPENSVWSFDESSSCLKTHVHHLVTVDIIHEFNTWPRLVDYRHFLHYYISLMCIIFHCVASLLEDGFSEIITLQSHRIDFFNAYCTWESHFSASSL